ncbi:hypothetical protein PR048_020386 [Dryococelus australis]|uniref:Uncharacterized protein n=1 Tax=Dryococelus australis TaxID=614101 RepID=A0ABQ9H682_9NEOP|nr:hypothetical protein PR048_020386 [Dryococelus australis]
MLSSFSTCNDPHPMTSLECTILRQDSDQPLQLTSAYSQLTSSHTSGLAAPLAGGLSQNSTSTLFNGSMEKDDYILYIRFRFDVTHAIALGYGTTTPALKHMAFHLNGYKEQAKLWKYSETDVKARLGRLAYHLGDKTLIPSTKHAANGILQQEDKKTIHLRVEHRLYNPSNTQQNERNEEVIASVKLQEQCYRQAPGIKDMKPVEDLTTSKTTYVPKRHMIMTVKEAYNLFQSEFPNQTFPSHSSELLHSMCSNVNLEKCMTSRCSKCIIDPESLLENATDLCMDVTLQQWVELEGRSSCLILKWLFFATSHGKGAVDGIGGLVKRFMWNDVKLQRANISCANDFLKSATKVSSKIKKYNILKYQVKDVSSESENEEELPVLSATPSSQEPSTLPVTLDLIKPGPGSYVHIRFATDTKKNPVTYVYAATCQSSVEEDNKVKVMCMNVVGTSGKIFRPNEQDISYIIYEQISAMLYEFPCKEGCHGQLAHVAKCARKTCYRCTEEAGVINHKSPGLAPKGVLCSREPGMFSQVENKTSPAQDVQFAPCFPGVHFGVLLGQ